MTIGKITSNTIQPTASTNTSSTAANNSKNIQNQISTKEQNLNRLSSDSKLSAAEKEKKRQEIQKEIDELNRKLELMRMKQEEAEKTETKKQEKEEALKKEVLKEERPEKTPSEKQTTDSLQHIEKEEEPKHIDMPIEDVQKMLTADYILQKEIAEKKVSSQTESTINILKSEIKQDKLYGTDTTDKKEEIASIREKENFWTEPKEQQETQILSPVDPNAKIIIKS